MQSRSHFDLRIWKEARALCLEIRTIVSRLPYHERGLADQMKRASDSVSANIAEGVGRATRKDFAKFLSIARGSAHEMTDHCTLIQDLKLIDRDAIATLIRRYRGLAAGIYAYMQAIESSIGK